MRGRADWAIFIETKDVRAWFDTREATAKAGDSGPDENCGEPTPINPMEATGKHAKGQRPGARKKTKSRWANAPTGRGGYYAPGSALFSEFNFPV